MIRLISVIICAHNPRPHYLRRVLARLKSQTLPQHQWELLLVDNASHEPLEKNWNLSWHSTARHVTEDELGLTRARLRAIAEARGDLLVFVDDDNLVSEDYLETALALENKFPFLGAWGGSIIGEFDSPPPAWCVDYLGYLAVRPVESDYWTNDPFQWQIIPFGAGLCVRKEVAAAYANSIGPLRGALDRRGQELMGGGDLDLAMTACTMGLGFGVFRQLSVSHLIPEERLTLEYVAEIVEAATASGIVLAAAYGKPPLPERRRVRRLALNVYKRLISSPEKWTLYCAERRGIARGLVMRKAANGDA